MQLPNGRVLFILIPKKDMTRNRKRIELDDNTSVLDDSTVTIIYKFSLRHLFRTDCNKKMFKKFIPFHEQEL